MKLRFSIIGHSTFLSLWEGREKIGEIKIAENRRLSIELLSKLDCLLRKSGADLKQVEKIELNREASPSLTSARIIETVKRILDFAMRERGKSCG